MGRPFSRDHEHYVLKNRMLAAAEQQGPRDRKGERTALAPRERDKTCFNCKLKKTCTQFRGKRSGGATGVVSFGGTDDFLACVRWEQAPVVNRGMSKQEIKSLMRGFMRAS
jgi:hypothetical protein